MNNSTFIAQLFLRLALGIGFMLPVLDRLGVLGAAGSPNVGWGKWENFVAYTHSLMPYLGRSAAGFFGFLATVAEFLFAILLIIGYQIKWTALGSFALTLIFALSMFCFAGYRAPFNYSVFTDSAASLLLAGIGSYQWSIDYQIQKNENKI